MRETMKSIIHFRTFAHFPLQKGPVSVYITLDCVELVKIQQ